MVPNVLIRDVSPDDLEQIRSAAAARVAVFDAVAGTHDDRAEQLSERS